MTSPDQITVHCALVHDLYTLRFYMWHLFLIVCLFICFVYFISFYDPCDIHIPVHVVPKYSLNFTTKTWMFFNFFLHIITYLLTQLCDIFCYHQLKSKNLFVFTFSVHKNILIYLSFYDHSHPNISGMAFHCLHLQWSLDSIKMILLNNKFA